MKQIIRRLLKNSDAICFDFDSTIIKYEGIDKLAKQKNCYDIVSNITKEAMEKSNCFSKSLEKRLNIIKPSINDIIKYKNDISFDNISSGLVDILNFLRNNNKNIFVISGGFEQLIFPYTKLLKIPNENVYCNSLIFDDDGNYLNFDKQRYTCNSNGKNKVINLLKKDNKNIIMIGDGITDLETKNDVSAFIGYGGNCIRKSIKDNADYYYTDFSELLDDIQ